LIVNIPSTLSIASIITYPIIKANYQQEKLAITELTNFITVCKREHAFK
jgi:hypothetical protein